MMQAAESRRRYDSTTCIGDLLCFTTRRRSLRERQMRPVLMVVTDVFAHQAFQMPFVENDDMVEQLPTAVPDPSLCDAILPRNSEAGPNGLNTETLHCLDHFFIEASATIEDQIAGRRIVGECLAQLLNDSGAGRMFGRIAVKDTAPSMRNDKQAVQHAESQRRHGEEVHGRDGFTVVVQKRSPLLCLLRASRHFPHPAQHRSLGDIETKHFQFSVNAWCAPSSVVSDHAKDEIAQFPADAFSPHASSMPRNPGPIHLESGSVPANNGLWLEED